jgi:small multidrug resistance pump
MRHIPVGVVYSVWSGFGIVLVTLIAAVLHKQAISWQAALGISLIIIGVVLVKVFSKSL